MWLMSMVMLSGNGLIPISQAISGLVSKWNLQALFLGVGVLLLFLALWAAFQPGVWIFGQGAKAE
jgi:hypothetical protein